MSDDTNARVRRLVKRTRRHIREGKKTVDDAIAWLEGPMSEYYDPPVIDFMVSQIRKELAQKTKEG